MKEGNEKIKAKYKGLPLHKLDQKKIHEPHDRAIQVSFRTNLKFGNVGHNTLAVHMRKSSYLNIFVLSVHW